MSPEDAEAIALFRFSLIAEAANPRITKAERGLIVQGLASFAHQHPDGTMVTYSRGTLDRWVRAYRAHGLAGLAPVPRSDTGAVRRHPELLAEAAALRAELPARSAAAIADILWQRHRVRVAERTIRSHLRRRGLHRAALGAAPRAFGRYEAERPNERWITDVLVGPFVPHPRVAGSRRARVFLIVDDHSRLLVHGRWVNEENTRAGQAVLRAAIARRGLPEVLYCDYADLRVMPTSTRTLQLSGGHRAEEVGIIQVVTPILRSPIPEKEERWQDRRARSPRFTWKANWRLSRPPTARDCRSPATRR